MNQIVYISTFLPRHKKDLALNNLKLFDNAAADTLSYAIFQGLSAYIGYNLLTINIAPIGPYPKCSKSLRYVGETYLDNDSKIIDIPFNTFFIYQHYSIYCSFLATLSNNFDKDTAYTLLLYSINLSVLKAVVALKKKGYRIKIILIIPDFWEDMLTSGSLKGHIKRLIMPDVQNLYSFCDGFVLLTKQMIERINVQKPYCVVEGMYNSHERRPNPIIKNNKEKIFFYSGMLHEKFGIVQLLRTFNKIDNPNIRLRICGSGDAIDSVKDYVERDKRISYLGLLDREQVLKEQYNADFLINPRTPEGEFTKYSFPSKTIEYLASGTPAIIHKLPGIPEEYYEHCITFPSCKDEGIIKTLNNVIELSPTEAYEIGYNAKKFIETSKTEIAQCKKIADFINSI